MKENYLSISLLITIFFVALASGCNTVSYRSGSSSLQSLGVSSLHSHIASSAATAINQILNDPNFKDITPEQEYYLGRTIAANILSRYSIQTNKPALTDYMNNICNTLVINSPRPEIFDGYRVVILDTDEINSFATTGGHIFITRGLIDCATSEDSLAAIIAHEIAHIQLRHGFASVTQIRINQALNDVIQGAVVAGTDYTPGEIEETFDSSVSMFINTLLNGYNREQEFEADRFAMSIMALTGYEPSAFIDMLKVLEKNQPGSQGGFNNTHPTPAQRITNVQVTVRNHDIPNTRSYRTARYASVR